MVPDRADAWVFHEGGSDGGGGMHTEEGMRMFPEVGRKEVSHRAYMIQILKNEQEFS